MRAARWHARGDVRVEEVPAPVPSAGEVLVCVELCGICGTDVEEYREGPLAIDVERPHPLTGTRAPLALGHEVVGVIAGHGPGTDAGRLPVGTRVIPDVVLGCGTCWWCRRHQEGVCARQAVRGLNLDGGLAEYMVADAATCVPVPDHVPPRMAVLAEPAAVAVRALRKAGDVTGGTALVLGAGAIGLLLTRVAVAAGIQVVTSETADSRREAARHAGAVAVRPEETAAAIDRLTDGRGADVVFECTGLPALLPEAIRRCRARGTVVIVGFSGRDAAVPLADLVLKEKRLVGTAAHLWDEDVTAGVRLLASGVIDPALVPVRVASLDEVPALLAVPDQDVVKVAIDPCGQEEV
ncbi:zinc-binding dehydrogenase [Microtetraspora malaysiensis]|uniref:zinc-binding dehydrogenase n=1 Tax=Microtetraspora malaysiensis TaxID=161358 RepID=UPI003D8C4C01